MKKTSNILITIGVILTIIVCIYKFVNFQAIEIPNIESKYLWWGLGLIGVIVVFVLISKSRSGISIARTSQASRFGKSVWIFTKKLAGLSLLLALICAILGGLFYGGLWLKNQVDSQLSKGNSTETKTVEVAPGLTTTVPITAGASNLEFHPPRMTRVEYLDGNQNPLKIWMNGRVMHSIITGPGIENDIAVESDNFRFIRFSSTENSGESYTFEFDEN